MPENRALIIDDTHEFSHMIAGLLKEIGMTSVDRETNFSRIISAGKMKNVPLLILLDYQLVANEEINKDKFYLWLSNVPSTVVLMLSQRDLDQVDELFAHGMADYLVKNHPSVKLKHRLAEVMGLLEE